MILVWIIVAIVLFSVIVLIHEFWHFKAARFFWVRVEEFWLWIPPRAKKLWTDKEWTLYSLNWLPLWGFVKLTWENPTTFLVYDKNWEIYNNKKLEKDLKSWKDIFLKNKQKLSKDDIKQLLKRLEENNAPYNLSKKPAWQQSIVILAWVFMNFLFASIIFSILFFIWVKPIWINTKIETDLDLKIIPNFEQSLESWLLVKKEWLIISPIDDSIAKKAWLKEWAVITNINWEVLLEPSDMIKIIENNKWKKVIIIWYERNLEHKKWDESIKQYPFKIKLTVWTDWKIWTYIWENIEINREFEYKYGFFNSIRYWFYETYNQSLLTLKALGSLWTKVFNPKVPEDRQEAIKQVSWPIGLVSFISNSISAWFIFILILWAIISINLWVFNLLPIPALDWWRFIFIVLNWLIQKIFWKKWVPAIIESVIHASFFIVLILLSIVIAYNDVLKIFSE